MMCFFGYGLSNVDTVGRLNHFSRAAAVGYVVAVLFCLVVMLWVVFLPGLHSPRDP